MRARRSSAEIGLAPAVMDFNSAAAEAGAVRAGAAKAAGNPFRAAMATMGAAAGPRSKTRLHNMIILTPVDCGARILLYAARLHSNCGDSSHVQALWTAGLRLLRRAGGAR